MKRDLRGIRALSCAGLLAAAAASCNAIIGLEVGQLDPSGAGGASSSTAAATGGGDGGEGGGAGGAVAAGGGGAGGGAEELCRQDREGAVRAPDAVWGDKAGIEVTDVVAHDDLVTAVIKNEDTSFSVARWSSAGKRQDRYGMTAGGPLSGEHTAKFLAAAGPERAYVAGWSARGFDPTALSGACAADQLPVTTVPSSFLLAVDENGKCRWVWSPPTDDESTPLGLAAAPSAVVVAASVKGMAGAEEACSFVTGDAKETVGIAAFAPEDGACLWSAKLGAKGFLKVGALVIDEHSEDLLVAGDYDTSGITGGGTVNIEGMDLMRSIGRDLFVARFGLDGTFKGATTINTVGHQELEQRAAALLEDGALVIAGNYSGFLDFEDDCPLPPADPVLNTKHLFVLRLSKNGIDWSRGFGDSGTDQWVTGVAADRSGMIYVTGASNGAIVLGNDELLTLPSEDPDTMTGFLMVLNPSGNVVSASELRGMGDSYVWAASPSWDASAPLYLGGEMNTSIDVGLEQPLTHDGRSGFIVQLNGAR